jgi:Zn-dependent protease
VEKVQLIVLVAPVLLFSMVAHEYAHGYAALKQGDPTAYQLGRLTWNPVKHIDPFLTVILPLFTFLVGGVLFGGAKPVPVNPRNYRRYKQGDIIVSMAGIAVNLVLAVVCTALIPLLGLLGRAVPGIEGSAAILQAMMFVGVLFNLVLAFFNLIPVPPLDGSHVMKYLLPPQWSLAYQRIAPFGMMILLLLITLGRPVFRVLMSPVYFFANASLRGTAGSFLPDAVQVLQNVGYL